MDRTPLKSILNNKKHLFTTPIAIPPSPMLQKLGYGTGVQVFKLNRAPSKNESLYKSPWAIKKINRINNNDETYTIRLSEEAKILKSLNHPNVVGFRSYQPNSDGKYILAMEMCTMSLGDFLEKQLPRNRPLEIEKIKKVGMDISKALIYLHDVALILHGDMKSFNVLIKEDFEICKLCDFGVSLPLTKKGKIDLKSKPNAQYIGTELWSAPEVFEDDNKLISTKSEIWSFGLMLFEMLALNPPHIGDINAAKSLSFDNTVDENMENMEELEDSCDDLNTSMLVGTRPNFPQNIEITSDYDDVLQIFYICTNDEPDERPSANILLKCFEGVTICK